jgi:hypothetical protein
MPFKAFYEGKGICYLQDLNTTTVSNTNNFELDGIAF